jgi:hypothetical protein
MMKIEKQVSYIKQENNNNICNNCFKIGHQIHSCKLPILSYGIIVFRFSK